MDSAVRREPKLLVSQLLDDRHIQHVGSSAITNVQVNEIADVRVNAKSTNYGVIINEAKTLLYFNVSE
ncbi:MAG: hypothetical protein J4G19_06675 [Pseudomonadales bacterium]|nr:hypothetical protein [Pseudomonadales bacterium]